MKTSTKTRQLTVLGLLTGILLLMAYTPLGYLNIGPLAISFNVIPVALAAITLGPAGGAAAGAVFGLTSFLQCIGVGGVSSMGVVLFGINPVLAFIQRFVPRLLDGLLLGYIFRGVKKASNARLSCFVTGFFSAFLNTLFFMTALVVLFGNTEYMQGLIGVVGPTRMDYAKITARLSYFAENLGRMFAKPQQPALHEPELTEEPKK